jgi:photosystem II stability/assembly factor-like uncharacterized protein
MHRRLSTPLLFLLAAAAGCAAVETTPTDVPVRDDAGESTEASDGGDANGDSDGADVPDGDVPDGCGAPPCTLGQRQCEPPPAADTIYRDCVTGPDDCLRWSDQQSCPTGQFCQENACVETCSNVCADGALQCATSSEYQSCEMGTRGCRVWGTPVACGAGLSCTGAGTCVTCADECDEGLVRCNATGQVLRCERVGSGCLGWVTDPACAPPQICWEGACVAACADVCTAGQMRCFGDDYQVCMRQPEGCLGWTDPYRCPSGRACAGEGLCPTCTDACASGEAHCDGTTAYEACTFNVVNGCWEWGASTDCGLHEQCEGDGVCTVLCTDGCLSAGTTECGPAGGVRECLVGALGCLEWTTEVPCPAVANGSNDCVGGACSLTCDGGYLTCGPTSCRVSCAPWTQQSPVPPYEELWALDFVGTTVWAVGNAGVVARSADRGVTWRNVGLAAGGTVLNGVDFASATVGWIVGNGGAIFRSDDGGMNWVRQTSGVTDNLRAVSFADTTHGWVVGDAGVILATTDGTTWVRQTSGLTTALFGVHFISATTGWAVGAGGQIRKTANGGTVWLPQTSGSTYDIRSVRFVDTDVGWAVGYYYAFRTTNGGTTWAPFTRSAIQYNAIFPTTVNAALIVGAGGVVETTADGGLTWSTRTSGTTAKLDAVVFLDALNAVTAGASGAVLSSSNGGSTWIDRRGGTVDNLRDVSFVDAANGWAVGAAGRIVATTDGGVTWSAQTSGSTVNLWGVWFADATHGWAVGENGEVRVTTNGGTNWTVQTSTTTGALYDVQFVDAYEGWMVGVYAAGSSVRYTPDAGTTWQFEPAGIPAGVTMYGVWFNPTGRGWVVGTSGTIRYTTDRGVSWLTPIGATTTQTLWDVHFVSDTAGFTVGAAGTVLVTTDGGVHWAVRGTPVSTILYGVVFVDANVGFITGAAGTFLKTFDGGASFSTFPAPTSRDLRGLSFLNANTGWVAGDYGTILVTRSGGE